MSCVDDGATKISNYVSCSNVVVIIKGLQAITRHAGRILRAGNAFPGRKSSASLMRFNTVLLASSRVYLNGGGGEEGASPLPVLYTSGRTSESFISRDSRHRLLKFHAGTLNIETRIREESNPITISYTFASVSRPLPTVGKVMICRGLKFIARRAPSSCVSSAARNRRAPLLQLLTRRQMLPGY